MLQNTRTRLVAPGLGSPTRWEALVIEPGTALPTEADRLVAAALRGDGPAPGEAAVDADGAVTWVPAVDVEEREDGVRLAFEVPGVDPDAIEVTVHDRVLTVSGERTFARADGGRTAYRLERRHGRFARRLTLPKTIDLDRIEARYEHGVLYLAVPKRPEAQPRRITISAAPPADDQPRLEGAPAER
jgi:HSP20 family protein